MRSKRRHQQSMRNHRRERRRLGRFVFFSEIEADLTPVLLFDQPSLSTPASSYLALLLRLTFLAPDITRAILERRNPTGFTAQKLVTYCDLPFAWPEQRQALGFA